MLGGTIGRLSAPVKTLLCSCLYPHIIRSAWVLRRQFRCFNGSARRSRSALLLLLDFTAPCHSVFRCNRYCVELNRFRWHVRSGTEHYGSSFGGGHRSVSQTARIAITRYF